jgi:soluble lytic murein transglycosylase
MGTGAVRAEETAALPPGGWSTEYRVTLPNMLTSADADLYRRIFALQERADWAGADQAIARLRDQRLMGHVQAQRYLHPRYKSQADELARWMTAYHDHPDAAAVFRLADRRTGKGGPALKKPSGDALTGMGFADDLGPSIDPGLPAGLRLTSDDPARAAQLRNQIRSELRSGDLAGAESILRGREAVRALSAAEYDYLKAQIAAGWFAHGDDRKAQELASEAARRSGQVVPRANWIAGLSLFRQDRFGEAARYFEALARTPNGEPWDLSSGAFWAARAHLRAKRPDIVNYWLSQAAEYPRTFYGLLATRTLGHKLPFNWESPTLTSAELETMQDNPAGKRALALLQVGEPIRAEGELRRLYTQTGAKMARPLLAIALRAQMPGLSMRLGREMAELDGRRHESALYPVPPWEPNEGYQVDRALVFAFMRQESMFNPRATSAAGAKGLMQLMPQTAQLMAGKTKVRGDELLEPKLNVSLGQRYIAHLLEHESVQGDLIRLAAAYNGGPGNLQRWKRKQELRGTGEDALLFIEGLPAPETRHFITRILYSYWMYAARLGQETPSLDEVAAGKWPSYSALDSQSRAPYAQNR